MGDEYHYKLLNTSLTLAIINYAILKWLYLTMLAVIAMVTFTMELVKAADQCSEYQFKSPFFPGKSCEDIYNKNPESHNWSGYYWITDGPSRIYCGMTYNGSSCEDIYNNNPETSDKSGYYRTNDSQWTYCNMTVISTGNYISICAGVRGLWKRIAKIDISAGDDCPGDWRKATYSNVSYCRVTDDGESTCSSASFFTNGTSYQKVCGRARGYQKGDTLAFYGSSSKTIDQDYVSGLSITYGRNPRQHIWTFSAGRGERFQNSFNCPCSDITVTVNNPPSFVDDNYYCESASVDRSHDWSIHYFNDPLWDGEGCVDNCCDNTIQPWFYHQLNATTQDDIEARICAFGPFYKASVLID